MSHCSIRSRETEWGFVQRCSHSPSIGASDISKLFRAERAGPELPSSVKVSPTGAIADYVICSHTAVRAVTMDFFLFRRMRISTPTPS